MPFNGSGSFSAPVVTGWPAVSSAVISSTAMNAVINDIIAGLSAVLVRDGQSAMTGDLDMGGNAITNTTFAREAKAADLPSAATCDIGGAAGRSVDITGTTTITSFGVAAEGIWKIVRFSGALTLTHNATSLILPGAADITTAAGDTLIALSLGFGNWVVVSFQEVEGYPTKKYVDDRVPAGVILLWSGSAASIPAGWKLCDGTSGTPDLRDRFVVGAGSSYAVGATGGADSVTLTTAQMPSHSHSFSATTGTAGNHNHGMTTAGSHYHTVYGSNSSGIVTAVKVENRTSVAEFLTGSPTNYAGDHTHSIDYQGNHSHTVSGTTGGAGSGSSHENRPPYYALCYIMKA